VSVEHVVAAAAADFAVRFVVDRRRHWMSIRSLVEARQSSVNWVRRAKVSFYLNSVD